MNLEEHLKKLLLAGHLINVNVEDSFNSLAAPSEFAHGAVVNRVAVLGVLLSENLAVSVYNVLCILVEEVINSDVELFVALDGARVVEHCAGEVTMLDVHVFESISALLAKQLVEERLL